MKKILNTLALSGAITLGAQTNAIGNEAKLQVDASKQAVTQVVEHKEISNQDLKELLEKKLSEVDMSAEKKDEIREIFADKEFQSELFSILKKEAVWSLESVIISLILGFLYGYAYNSTIKKVRKQFMPIDPKSFGIFGLTSGGMVLVNGFIPGSIVYFLSFTLASYAVLLHYNNVKSGKVYSPTFQQFFEENPLPVVRYNKEGTPLIWNKKMEEETGYSIGEIQEYYNKHGEVMSLLYSGDELERVRQYISQVENTGTGYKNVAFTMITKSGEHKTFLWTTQPDGQGGTIRIAKHLTDEGEIKRELNETLQLLRQDILTGALNRKAYQDDLKNIFGHIERKNETPDIILVMMDIDNFKNINDSFGHDAGDEVLKTFSNIVQSNIRSGDKIYRIGGDEFVIIFKTDEFQFILDKLNKMREMLFNYRFFFDGVPVNGVGSSWGVKNVNLTQLKNDIQSVKEKKILDITSEIDQYMYAVKHLVYIQDKLMERGIEQKEIVEKNGIGYPLFQENEFIGVHVYNSYGKIFVSKEELDLIIARKQSQALEKLQ